MNMSKKEYSRIKLGKIEELVKSGQFEEIREVFRHQVENEEGVAAVKKRKVWYPIGCPASVGLSRVLVN